MSTKPIFINLLKIRLPLAAFMSITHRLSGIALFFIVIPFSAYLYSNFTRDEMAFTLMLEIYSSNFIFRTFVLFAIFIFQYHMFVGIRHMIHDFHLLPETLESSEVSAQVTIVLFLINSLITFWVML
ncbi:MAG: succinate dehydrogenase, cytochrome b556 subunit [Gammaproteobacteria bacterium]